MGRPKGAKNIGTRVREAEAALGVSAPDLDSLHVLEQTMAYFYLRGMALKSKGGSRQSTTCGGDRAKRWHLTGIRAWAR
jgi:hypothetical protein